MAYEPLKVNTIDVKKKVDEPHEGYFTGREDITTKIGPQIIWRFRGKDGNPFGIYGFTNLNYCMKNAPVGVMIRVTYTGTEKRETKYGLKDVHQVLVEIDREDTLTHGPDEDGDPLEDPFTKP